MTSTSGTKIATTSKDLLDIESRAGEERDTSGNISQEDEIKIRLHLHLLDNQIKQSRIPRWMKYYELATYIVCSIIAVYSIIYLIFIGVYQAHPRMQIQYSAIVRYLEYNSYSILSPLLCPCLMALLMYHVRYRVKLDEGDFFGLLGLFLMFALINIHDSWGILKLLQWNGEHDLTNLTSPVDPPAVDPSSRNDFHWQYAWSTRTTCAKKFVQDLQYKYEYSKQHVVQQIVLQAPPHEVVLGGAESRSMNTYSEPKEIECNDYHDLKKNAKTRHWMEHLQKEFKCCGPYGFNERKEWFEKEKDTKCNKKWMKKKGKVEDIPSCFDPLMRWLDGVMISTYWIMLFQAIFYIICMFVAGLHHSAMKYEEEKVEKKYSLLNMSDNFLDSEPHWWATSRPDDCPVIVGHYPPIEHEDDDRDLHLDISHIALLKLHAKHVQSKLAAHAAKSKAPEKKDSSSHKKKKKSTKKDTKK